MRCFYLDPGLRGDRGHHANFLRYIGGGLETQGVELQVFGYHGMAPETIREFNAVPLFRAHTYFTGDGDPICGWLTGFEQFVQTTLEDLARLPPVEPSDLVYLSTAWPAQLQAVLLWYRGLPERQRPCLVIEVNETGMTGRVVGQQIHFDVPDPRSDARPTLFRFIGRRHLQPVPPRVHIVSFEPTTAATLAQLIGHEVRAVSLPYRAVGPLRSRIGARPVTIACLGHQTERKGYPLLPALARALLQRHAGIRLLIQAVHIGDAGAEAATAALRALAAREPRLALDEAAAGLARWPALLGQADLILCPYQAEAYLGSFSSMACEAVANGIPLVVPASSTLATLLSRCGEPGVAFAQADGASILAATEAALEQFDLYAERAYRAALAWPRSQGPDRLAEQLLALAGSAEG